MSDQSLGTGALRVVSVNLWYRNDSYAPAINYLMQTDADVIGLVEAKAAQSKPRINPTR